MCQLIYLTMMRYGTIITQCTDYNAVMCGYASNDNDDSTDKNNNASNHQIIQIDKAIDPKQNPSKKNQNKKTEQHSNKKTEHDISKKTKEPLDEKSTLCDRYELLPENLNCDDCKNSKSCSIMRSLPPFKKRPRWC